jgi:hypothetical protein
MTIEAPMFKPVSAPVLPHPAIQVGAFASPAKIL